jgi:hypothetical protein
MGIRTSRPVQSETETRNTITVQQETMSSAGTIFGPSFVLQSTGVPQSNDATRAFIEEIINILGTGITTSDAMDLHALGSIYGQYPPSEIKKSISLQSQLHVHKSSIKMIKNKGQSSYNVSFKFDTLCSAVIRLYWGSKEILVANGQKDLHYEYDLINSRYKSLQNIASEYWEFGPFEAGLDQTFTLPDSNIIDDTILSIANMEWVTKMHLDGMVSNPSSPVITKQKLPEIGSAAPSSSEQIEIKIPFDPNLSESAYHLIVEIREINSIGKNPDVQSTLLVFEPTRDNRIGIHYAKQLAMVIIQII